ncbi:hypothetical protein MTR_2g095720 [Medicago truncatula]|uniref:Uncharacterized protein n=1 Tax=Medicago truncatula TaxID=3880 RepID=G7IU64_MEDTR|nr:hypothetical protein MTR_2g095720 [Medicago truncatula]
MLEKNGQVIFSTSPQEHYFDCPYQLSSERVGQTYLDATVTFSNLGDLAISKPRKYLSLPKSLILEQFDFNLSFVIEILLLNVPPNSSGLIYAEDIQVLREFSKLRCSIFSHNLAASASQNSSSARGGFQDTRFSPYKVLEEGIHTYWAHEENQSKWILYTYLKELVSFIVLQVLNRDGLWKSVVNGTTIGYQRLSMFPKPKSQYLKLIVDKSGAEPLISNLGIYMDPITVLTKGMHDKKLGT